MWQDGAHDGEKCHAVVGRCSKWSSWCLVLTVSAAFMLQLQAPEDELHRVFLGHLWVTTMGCSGTLAGDASHALKAYHAPTTQGSVLGFADQDESGEDEGRQGSGPESAAAAGVSKRIVRLTRWAAVIVVCRCKSFWGARKDMARSGVKVSGMAIKAMRRESTSSNNVAESGCYMCQRRLQFRGCIFECTHPISVGGEAY